LLGKYQPKVITTEKEYKQFIALALKLEHNPLCTPEKDALLELLFILIN